MRGLGGRFQASRSPRGPAPQPPAARAARRTRSSRPRTGAQPRPGAGGGSVSRSVERSAASARSSSSALSTAGPGRCAEGAAGAGVVGAGTGRVRRGPGPAVPPSRYTRGAVRGQASRSPSGPAPHRPARRAAVRGRAGRAAGCTRRSTAVSIGAGRNAMSCSLLGRVAAAGEGTAGKEKTRRRSRPRPAFRTPRGRRVTEPLRGPPAAAGDRLPGRSLVDSPGKKPRSARHRRGGHPGGPDDPPACRGVSGGMAGWHTPRPPS